MHSIDMTYLGLLRQRGPFKETRQDLSHVYEKDKNWEGGGVPVGGTAHAGHGFWSATMNPPNKAPRFYVLPPGQPIVSRIEPTTILQKGGNKLQLRPRNNLKNAQGIIVAGSARPSSAPVAAADIFYSAADEDSYGDTLTSSQYSSTPDLPYPTRSQLDRMIAGDEASQYESVQMRLAGEFSGLASSTTSASFYTPLSSADELSRQQKLTPSNVTTFGPSVYSGLESQYGSSVYDSEGELIRRNKERYLALTSGLRGTETDEKNMLAMANLPKIPGAASSMSGLEFPSSSSSSSSQPSNTGQGASVQPSLSTQPPSYSVANINEANDNITSVVGLGTVPTQPATTGPATALNGLYRENTLQPLPQSNFIQSSSIGSTSVEHLRRAAESIQHFENLISHNQYTAPTVHPDAPVVERPIRRTRNRAPRYIEPSTSGSSSTSTSSASSYRPARRSFGPGRRDSGYI